MAGMTEARLRKIVREEIGRQIRETYYEPRLYDTSAYEQFYDTTLGDEEEWVEDTEEEEEGEDGSAGEWNPWTGRMQYRDPVTGQTLDLDERRLRLLRRR